MRLTFVLLFAIGCFEHHGIDDASDAARRDATGFDAGRDVDICHCASDLDCPPPEGCIEQVCDDCLCQPQLLPGCDDCMCMIDADCPPPPPFGDCVRTRCVDCTCTFLADDSICGPEAFCDADTFLCTPSQVEVLVLLRTDLEPVAEFDLVTVTSGMDYQEYRPAPGDPFFSMGVIVAVLHARPGTDLFVALDVWRGESPFASREQVVRVEEGAVAAFTVER